MPELRGFVLKNANRFSADPRGPDCFSLLCDLFLVALQELHQDSDIHLAFEGLTAYVDKMVSLISPARLPDYAPAFDQLFQTFAALSVECLLILAQSHNPLRRTVILLLRKVNKSGEYLSFPLDPKPICMLAIRSLLATYQYWLHQSDPEWFAVRNTHPCDDISHRSLRAALVALEELATQPHDLSLLARLVELPSFIDIVRGYRNAAEQLGQTSGDTSTSNQQIVEERKLRFLFHIMETDGLTLIHEETLREINRSLIHLVELEQKFDDIHVSLLRAFALLKAYVVKYPRTALQNIEVLGAEVFKHENSQLVEAFLGQVVRFGFQYSAFRGVSDDWQPLCNPSHLYNIRVWVKLLSHNPKWSSTLLSALIINLKLSGVLIRDTDMFQKEITHLLNSEIRPIYNLFKQFARLLPVYYNEIGAEGELREVSTELDEISRRQDRLIHFLRKQCHVESTNRIVDLVQNIFIYWRTGNLTVLEGVVSSAVLADIEPSGIWFDGVHHLVKSLCQQGQVNELDDTARESSPLHWSNEALQQQIFSRTEFPEVDRRRVILLIRLYHLLDLKYNLGFLGIRAPLLQAIGHGIPRITPLLAILEKGGTGYTRLEATLNALESLKEVVLSNEHFPAREEIFQKRHIAVDIPSVYGCYQEMKFDALALSFRLENLAKLDLEELHLRIPETFVTRATFFKVSKYLKIFLRALKLDGIVSRRMENMCEVLDRFLELNQFSFHQYLDIFRNFSEGIKDVIHTYYTTHHRDNLAILVSMIPQEMLMPRFAALKDDDEVSTLERISEAFLRDLIAETFGLQAFDLLITRLRRILLQQQELLSPDLLTGIMTYDPAKLFCPLHTPDQRTRTLIHLGNKGFNLIELVRCAAPVPSGVVLTTEYFRCQDVIHSFPLAEEDFMERLRRQVSRMESETGLRFGHPETPLLLSVRSGALISMPGMMQTIHNVGINEQIVSGLARSYGNDFFAWDNYRRFIQSWSMSFNAPRSAFSDLMWAAKVRHAIKRKRELTTQQMSELAKEYHQTALNLGIPIPMDPWEQLLAAIKRVIASWNSAKAKEYRRIMDIADDWGTAVVLQRMVYGNLHDHSGSGVLFTGHPHRKLDRVLLWGDYTSGNQGEDIVGGLVTTNPISLEQCHYDKRDPSSSLEICYPEIYNELRQISQRLVYEEGWNPQEIEFTFEGPNPENLYLLQSRDMLTTKHGAAIYHRFRDTPLLKKNRLARGLGVSGGALCGLAVFNLEQIQKRRAVDPNVSLILIRYDTVPDDIKEIALANGLLTTRGGQTSHAAIVAARLEKTCVVGCASLTIRQSEDRCEVDAEIIREGDEIGIDGHAGFLYKGWHPIQTSVMQANGGGE
ncbi:PEP/pyruvate-binding domain-containing protein [Candidatus Magnetaquicoccus inordinatus]|uniref:PEP/pyruvate-binding domain-containing protein n=1 Tax=Candidatus Magnetaquicoccus inordinatus TaxID=2496818 RepID=UPI001D0E4FAC|nr:PEP/pyruvate-binding domain-containing protein [Candidatus Magnetaquicoccus inordinatus]